MFSQERGEIKTKIIIQDHARYKIHLKKWTMKNFSEKTERLLIETKLQLKLMGSSNMLAQNWLVKFLTHWGHLKFLLKIDKEISSFYFPLMNQKNLFSVKMGFVGICLIFQWNPVVSLMQ